MLVDARQLEPDQLVEADLCIVGGGAAGLTLALELLDTGLSVVILESGALEYDQQTQALYSGTETGTFLRPDSNYLVSSRLRHLGGTTNHWHGWCRPLDPEDFEPRPWVDRSGWPLSREDLDPYYERALGVIGIAEFDDVADREGRPMLFEPGAPFETTFLHVNPHRFGPAFRRKTRTSDRIRTCLFANVTEILVDAAATRVEGLEVATLEGGRFRVRAAAYVLAAGGIENARLLLASNRSHESGLGNDRDLVGRCFMEHPLVRVGYLVSSEPEYAEPFRGLRLAPGGRSRGRKRGLLRLRHDLQREHGLVNAMVILWPVTPVQYPDLARHVVRLAGEIQGVEVERTPCWVLGVAVEQRPSESSRVRLGEELDELGMRRAVLDWRLTDQEVHTVRRNTELLAVELGATLRGRMMVLPERDDPWSRWGWSNHHMGTTRMDPDPARGVVDADCRVHGLGNLYVAGSSVFPTSGCSNPTLTIVALTLRLADTLKRTLSSPGRLGGGSG